MATITLPDEQREISHVGEIAEYLAQFGITYEQWECGKLSSEDATEEEILDAYRDEIEQLKAKGGTTVGEDYLPLGNTEVTPIITKIKAALPEGGVIFNSLNGDSNVAFFKQLQGAGMTPDMYPVMSVSIAEEEVRQMLLSRHIEDGAEYLLPCPVGEVLCRFCRNLVHQYTLSSDLHRARQFAGYIQEFENAYERESA